MTNYREILYAKYFSHHVSPQQQQQRSELFAAQKRQFAHEVLPLLPKDNTTRMLDIGCGSGSLLAACKDAGFANVVGVDVSEEMVQEAHNNGVPEVVCGHLVPFLEARTGQFDVITGMDIIEHFTKDELVHVLQCIQAALRPGGMVIFRTPNADAPLASLYTIGDFTHENTMNLTSAFQVMRSVGYSNVAVLPSRIRSHSIQREILRIPLWFVVRVACYIALVATSRSIKHVVLTPNMIIVANS
jgi:2-polyprenyl-3-methyl-5-hydroxy-6-metoxy-1,4-benzoquinol methylase